MKARLTGEGKKLALILLCGTAYLFFVLLTGLSVPCPFHLVTGLKCPSCGITDMFLSAARLDFKSAFAYNPVVFVSLPVLLILYLAETARYIRTGKRKLHPISKGILIIEAVVLILYGIIRNIG